MLPVIEEIPESLTVRWKVFRFINYLQVIVNAGFLALMLIVIMKTGFESSPALSIISVLIFAFQITNNLFNIHLLNKHYPYTTLSRKKEKVGIVLLIVYIFVTIGLLIMGFSGLIDIFSDDYNYYSLTAAVSIIFFLTCNLLNIYIIIEQASLPTHIERNNKKNIRRITEEIGKPADLF